jgi:hypothetical protein
VRKAYKCPRVPWHARAFAAVVVALKCLGEAGCMCYDLTAD